MISKFYSKKIFKDIFALGTANILLQPIQLLKSFVVLKVLGPDIYGSLKSVEMLQMLDKYGNLGFNATARREIGHARGSKDVEYEKVVRNNTYSGEIILATILFLLGILLSFFFSKDFVWIIIFASFSLFFSKIRNILSTEASIQKNFLLISKTRVFSTISSIGFIFIFINSIKIYAVLIGNGLLGLIATIYLFKKLKFNYEFKIDFSKMKKLLFISIPLTFNTLALGSYKYSERILVLTLLGQKNLGFYSFAVTIGTIISTLLKTAITVRVQDLYELLGDKKYKNVNKIVIYETLLLLIASIGLIFTFWLLLDFLIPRFLPKWSDSIIYAKALLFIILAELMSIHPSYILISALVNKVKLVSLLRLISSIVLCSLTFIISYVSTLDLLSFIYVNIISYFLYSLAIMIYYYFYFYRIYVAKNS